MRSDHAIGLSLKLCVRLRIWFKRRLINRHGRLEATSRKLPGNSTDRAAASAAKLIWGTCQGIHWCRVFTDSIQMNIKQYQIKLQSKMPNSYCIELQEHLQLHQGPCDQSPAAACDVEKHSRNSCIKLIYQLLNFSKNSKFNFNSKRFECQNWNKQLLDNARRSTFFVSISTVHLSETESYWQEFANRKQNIERVDTSSEYWASKKLAQNNTLKPPAVWSGFRSNASSLDWPCASTCRMKYSFQSAWNCMLWG